MSLGKIVTTKPSPWAIWYVPAHPPQEAELALMTAGAGTGGPVKKNPKQPMASRIRVATSNCA